MSTNEGTTFLFRFEIVLCHADQKNNRMKNMKQVVIHITLRNLSMQNKSRPGTRNLEKMQQI